jgi:hypothetical protein
MNFFRRNTTWTNAEFIPLKLCVASAYIIIGAYFADYVKQFFIPICIVFLVTVTWSMLLWIRKMKQEIHHYH